jgi:sulfide:quinone oxidoreductase
MSQTAILGAGFGGIATAYELRSMLGPEHEIALIDRNDSFLMGLRKLWALVGSDSLEQGRRPLAELGRLGINVVQADVLTIDAAKRAVQTSRGFFQADQLVIALGSESRPDLVEGLAERGHNVWKASEVPAAARALEDLVSGRVLILIAGAPYPCPPAPYECAMLVDEFLRERGRRMAVEVSVTTIQPLLLPNAGKEGSAWLASQLADRNIRFQVGKKIVRVDRDRVVYEDGEDTFDMLIAVPPHRPPAVVRDSGLVAESGWMSVDAGTLETEFPGVYALGDVTLIRLANGLPLPKAGVMAELEGTRVARAIAANVLGEANVPPFDGKGFCFMELGRLAASLVEGDFYASPEPRVVIADPSLRIASLKRTFESERLTRWFGTSANS